MKNGKMNTLHQLRLGSAIPLVIVSVLIAAITTAAQPSQSSQAGSGGHPMMMQGGMMRNGMMSGRMRGARMSGRMMSGNMWARCNEIMAMHRRTQIMMKKQDAELQQLVTQMKQAPAARRMAFMENILTHLVNEQATMDQHMANMNLRMMNLMRSQVRMDMMSGGKGKPAPSMMHHKGNMGGMGGRH